MKKYAFSGLVIAGALVMTQYAFADTTGVVASANAIMNAASLTFSQLLTDILAAVQGFGGLAWSLKIACIVMLLIGSMKVSALNDLVWNKIPANIQAWVSPILGLILGVLLLGSGGNISLAGIFAYMGSASGAIILHELLELVKAIPGLGAVYVGLINMIEGVLPAPLSKKKA